MFKAWRNRFGCIEGFDNSRRLHSALGSIDPADAERGAALTDWTGGRSD
jgi:putative transposase